MILQRVSFIKVTCVSVLRFHVCVFLVQIDANINYSRYNSLSDNILSFVFHAFNYLKTLKTSAASFHLLRFLLFYEIYISMLFRLIKLQLTYPKTNFLMDWSILLAGCEYVCKGGNSVKICPLYQYGVYPERKYMHPRLPSGQTISFQSRHLFQVSLV